MTLPRVATAVNREHPPHPTGVTRDPPPEEPWTPLVDRTYVRYRRPMNRSAEIEQMRRSIAMLTPGAPAALAREEALQVLRELGDVQSRLDHLTGELRRLADEHTSSG